MPKRTIAALMLCLTAGGCATDARPGKADPVPVSDINFTLSSWGRLVVRWQLRADGSGEWVEPDGSAGPKQGGGTPVVTLLPADPAHLAEIRRILAHAEAIAPKGLTCRKEIFDLPYGSIEWNRADGKRRINFDLGCSSKQVSAVYDALKAADDKMRGWADAVKKGKTD